MNDPTPKNGRKQATLSAVSVENFKHNQLIAIILVHIDN